MQCKVKGASKGGEEVFYLPQSMKEQHMPIIRAARSRRGHMPWVVCSTVALSSMSEADGGGTAGRKILMIESIARILWTQGCCEQEGRGKNNDSFHIAELKHPPLIPIFLIHRLPQEAGRCGIPIGASTFSSNLCAVASE
jgi:hypothetical protein